MNLHNAQAAACMTGQVTRVVATHGSHWGQLTPDGTARVVFFNRASFTHSSDLDLIHLGQRVRFEEEADPVNGTRAIHVLPFQAEPYTDFSRPSGR
jgi:hypothetical protein